MLYLHNKTSYYEDNKIGYGINIDNPRIGMLSSPCEYLTLDAFNKGVRKSSTNKQFDYWLPILIKSDDWKNIHEEFINRINKICQIISLDKADLHAKVFKICSSIMNTLVVEIMNNKNNISMNDKFIDGYFAIYRLLKMFSVNETSRNLVLYQVKFSSKAVNLTLDVLDSNN